MSESNFKALTAAVHTQYQELLGEDAYEALWRQYAFVSAPAGLVEALIEDEEQLEALVDGREQIGATGGWLMRGYVFRRENGRLLGATVDHRRVQPYRAATREQVERHLSAKRPLDALSSQVIDGEIELHYMPTPRLAYLLSVKALLSMAAMDDVPKELRSAVDQHLVGDPLLMMELDAMPIDDLRPVLSIFFDEAWT